ncbi:MAG: hypothetical protein Q4D98_13900 [Planctomycetia bacterium]|nr:hypothetical protein [Planctomycetia bacterium]
MPHSLLFTKKRGEHRTDSRLAGVIAEMSFAVFCILLGIAGLIWIFAIYILPEWQVHEHYQRTVCTLEDFRVVQKNLFTESVVSGDTGQSSLFLDEDIPPEAADAEEEKEKEPRSAFPVHRLRKLQYKPEFLIRYEVDGKTYKNWTFNITSISQQGSFATEEEANRFLGELRKGSTYYCWFDPEDPDKVVITCYWSWENVGSLLIPLSLLVIGLGALTHLLLLPRLGSKEYSAVAAQRVARLTPFEKDRVNPEYPTVPAADIITDSPGTHFAYRLSSEVASPGSLLILLLGLILSFVFVANHFVVFLSSCSAGEPEWVRLLFIVPFGAVWLVLLYWTLRRLRMFTLVGPTLLELDRFPIVPGDSARLYLSQGGQMKLNWYNVILVCEEEVVFTHGTNTRRETQRVFQKQLFGAENVQITPAGLFETEIPLTLPPETMHSFVSGHSRIRWKIIVQGSPVKCPMFERSFPILVYPKGAKP